MKDSKGLLGIALSYLGFSVTDGAIRVLVVLYFHNLGFSPLEVASLFLLYEVAGIFTNFLGGAIGSALGLNVTLIAGMLLQVICMFLLSFKSSILSVSYIMLIQGFSGIAKDLVKMSSKSSLKVLNLNDSNSQLFTWVSRLTGSKNALKGVGYLLGGILLTIVSFQTSMLIMAALLFLLTCFTFFKIPKKLGKLKKKKSLKSLFSKSKEINVLSLARFFLFGSRDIWFVIALPVFLQEYLNWSYSSVGSFLAFWIIGYGIVQTLVPRFIDIDKHKFNNKTVSLWTLALAIFPASIACTLYYGLSSDIIIVVGLLLFGFVFALNSIIHSYLVLAFSNSEGVSADVGFYYMANAAGRLVGTLLSGWIYQSYGFIACLWYSVAFIVMASIVSGLLPTKK